jgi:hypothetical protein
MSRVRKNVLAKQGSWFQTMLFKITMFLIVVITLPAIFIFQAKRSKEAKETSSVVSRPSFDWIMPAPPLSRGKASYPSTPKLLKLKQSQTEHSVAGYDTGSLSLKLEQLIKSHPDSHVNHDLDQKIIHGEIFLNWWSSKEMAAKFQVVPKSKITGVFLQPGTQMKEFTPTLTIDPFWLANLMTPDEIIFAYLVLFHEYVHYQQYIETTDEQTKQLFSTNFLSEAEKEKLHITQDQSCAHMWFAELDAYAQECRLANEWGYPFGDQFCLYVDSPLWSQAFFTMLFNSQTLDPKYKTACMRVHAKLAGHPHPELFKR